MTFTLDVILPLAILALAAVVIPVWLSHRLPRRLGMVLLNGLLSGLLLYALGALLLAGLYLWQAPGLGRELADNPLGGFVWLLRQGLVPVVFWLPVLALTEVLIAQKIGGEMVP